MINKKNLKLTIFLNGCSGLKIIDYFSKKKIIIVNDEINIRNAIIHLWSEKKLVILISLISMFFGFLYSSIQL